MVPALSAGSSQNPELIPPSSILSPDGQISTAKLGLDEVLCPESRDATVSPQGGYEMSAHDDVPHTHSHPHTKTKQVVDQLARSAGHITSVRRMVEEGRPCPDVLIQLAAVRAAIDRASRLVLEDHVESCLRGAASNGMADEEWERLKRALDSFIR